MVEIIKAVREHMPACTFVGKKYSEADRTDGSYSAYWDLFFQKGWFHTLETAVTQPEWSGSAYYGLMGGAPDYSRFEYWIGVFAIPGTAAPEGFEAVDLPESDVGVCWLKGKDGPELYMQHENCMARLEQEKMADLRADFRPTGWMWFFERYGCPNFTTPDPDGNVILEYGALIR